MNPNFTKIEDFKGIHKGKRLFILASGPSLSELDLSRLKHRIVMGLNRSSLIYPETHYHCTMDQRLFDEYPEVLRKSRYLFTFDERPFGIPMKLIRAEGFSFNLCEGIYSGYTVSYFALQVAAYMGFSQIFYLGLDLKNESYRTHFFGKDFHSENHDTTEYPKMIRMMEYGADALKDHDIELYNCSPVADLKGFEKVDYDWAISL